MFSDVSTFKTTHSSNFLLIITSLSLWCILGRLPTNDYHPGGFWEDFLLMSTALGDSRLMRFNDIDGMGRNMFTNGSSAPL